MNFMQWLNSLDDLLFEVMSWFVFFPVTLWRCITRPLTTMNYADWELHDKDEDQFTDTLSPPLFLVLSLLVSHAIGLAIGDGTNPIVASNQGLAGLVSDNTTLLMLKLVVFSVLPLMFAVRFVRASRTALTRDHLRAPFYAQCYAAGPFALIFGACTALAHTRFTTVATVSVAIMLVSILAYIAVQARWFARHLDRSVWVGLLNACRGFLTGAVFAFALALLFAGPTLD